MGGNFWVGVGAGVIGTWAFHRFVKPMSTKAS